jgi:nucleotide-binding universal stress UspA family protein
MPLIKKILFPVDFSESCFGAARYMEALAGQFEAEIMLLHIVGNGENKLAEELLPVRKAQLDAFLAGELKYFSTYRVCVMSGDASKEIAEAARSWCPDLIVMPTHGLGFFRRLLLGSVTTKVLHDVDCPVWTSVHAKNAPPLEAIHCRRILCALDLSERSLDVLEWAAWLAGEYQACLGIVHAAIGFSQEAYGEEFMQYILTQAKTRIEELKAEAGATAEVFVNPGEPAKVVACATRDFDADLLVIGRHGGTGFAGHLFPNAYSILCHSPCPVISV